MYNTKHDRSGHKAIRWTADGAGDSRITRRIWFEHQTWPIIDTPERLVFSDLGIRPTIPTRCCSIHHEMGQGRTSEPIHSV